MSKTDNKLRVYEYAKSLNMSSKEIITILKRQNIPVNNHMSVMENDAVEAVERFFRDIKANAAAKRAAGDGGNVNVSQAKQQQGSTQAAAPKQEQRPNAGGTVQQQGGGQQGGQQHGGQQRQGEGRPQGQGGGNRDGGRPQGYGGAGQGGGRPHGQGGGNRDGRPQGQGGPGRDNRPQGQGGPRQGDRPGQRPQGGGFGGGAAAGAGPRGGGGAPAGARPGDSRRPGAQQQNPRFNPRTTTMDESDDSNKAGAKKAKQNQRFEENKMRGRGGKGNRGRQPEQRKEKIDNTPKKIIVRGEMTVGETAKLLHKEVSEVIKKLFMMGVMATINQELDLDTIQLIATEYGVEVELKIAVDEDNFELIEEKDDETELEERPPVVTIMGHVDHGKTTLLDAIRETNVTAGEAGGITQHIGAYQVEINNKKITFLDTPGHEAFTSMRARGAQVTDITILVVAADDGVMPQTVEAIAHAKAANVPIIVAVNKIDKPGANPDRIKQDLTEHGLVPEEWGGDTIFVELSAKQRINLEGLLEMILLVAEVQEYKANPNKRARGTVIEAELDKGKGPVARVLVQHGTLKVGDSFVAGVCFGRVRTLTNDKGKRLKEAGPSTPVEITGLTEVPQAGDPFLVYEDERKARAIAERRAATLRQSTMGANTRVTLDDLHKKIQEGDIKDLNVIIKADVQGSAEALRGSLEKIDVEGARVKIIHSGVGAITESDISLASASNAIVIGFNVRPEPQAMATAEQEKVDVRLHRIIYNVIEEIEQAMKGMLDPVFKETVLGQAEVRNVFKITGVGTVAGCMITNGKITRSASARLIRAGIVVFEGKIDSLKRFKDDVREVAQGYECGISLERYNDIKEGDVIEAFILETVER
ncbi:translation initiation factor IF-2 [Gordoniibacillus kamchatkensis]|uniref:Translation initiation factor IF-2 n=1 Tax=Gordoniibacillus kamchatkensis TaxID=1590651 RepID=A0ABR5ADS9_9BACL|nr:translation initiation factor IF-2 [Paenibacillus sp. VKM B-2647]KIL39206.1 translation initiation factor IF-2 [Paenibacillus sp. VKM B-2647]